MDQKMKSVLADCYNEISKIWMDTARIAAVKLQTPLRYTDECEFWEAFERRCCIRAGYYARLAEQHRVPPLVEISAGPRLRSLDEVEKIFKQTTSDKPQKKGGIARAKKLSKKRRREIAVAAAKARWKRASLNLGKEHPDAS